MGLFSRKKEEKKAPEKAIVPGEKIQDSVKQIANDELLGRWRSFRLDQTDDNMSAFLEELIERAQLLLVILAEKPVGLKADGTLDTEEDSDVRFPLMSTSEGQSIQPVFTDWQAVNQLFDNWDTDELKQNVEQAQVLPIAFVDLATMIEKNESIDGIAINPFDDNVALQRDSVLDLLRQARENHATAKEISVAVSDPTDLDDAHWDKIAAILKEHDAVSRAWIREAHYADRDALLLIIDTPGLPLNEAKELGQIIATAGLEAMDDTDLDFQVGPYNQDANPVIGEDLPRYVR